MTSEQHAVVDEADVLVDGPFIEELKSLDIGFRGSKNQRFWYKNQDGDWIFKI